MWLATRNHMAISFSHAGTSKQLAPAGIWVGAMSEEERELHFGDTLPSIPDWDDEWGDRVTKLVFIGIDMDRAEIKRTLDETLLAEEEMRMNWRELKDPFPAWR